MDRLYVCPSCKKSSAPLGENKSFPFCSSRCRTLDLGAWLEERYRVEAEPTAQEFSPEDPLN